MTSVDARLEQLTKHAEEATCVRRIDEKLMNDLLIKLPPQVKLDNLIRHPLPEPSRHRVRRATQAAEENKRELPKSLRQVIKDFDLLSEPDPERRFQLFAGYCLMANYTYNTARYYAKLLRSRGLFSNESEEKDETQLRSQLSPDQDGHKRPQPLYMSKLAFANSGKPHTRTVEPEAFGKLVRHLQDNWSEYTAPLLLAVFTGLRTFEVLQTCAEHLLQLQRGSVEVSIKRKQTLGRKANAVFWRPVYTNRLLGLIRDLCYLYQDRVDARKKHGVDSLLFHITPRTLINRFRLEFFRANNYHPPLGFGIHSCRNMIATLMTQQSENVLAVQKYLQHKRLKNTNTYIKADYRYLTKRFDELTRYKLDDVRRTLEGGGRDKNHNN